jgi:5-(carboxyamino)imidazole ribonucleotide mutase
MKPLIGVVSMLIAMSYNTRPKFWRDCFLHIIKCDLREKVMPNVAIVMGSKSDWPTMQKAALMLEKLGVSYTAEVISAHRTPNSLSEFAEQAAAKGYQVIIGGAGGAAHLPGMIAAHTHLPVFGVPVRSSQLNGIDSLLSIVQMPKGVAVGTLAIGEAGAANAGLLAAQVVGLQNPEVQQAIINFRAEQTATVLAQDELVLPSL